MNIEPKTIEIVAGRIERVHPSDRNRLSIDGVDVELPRGAVIIPGIVDTHCHLMGMGEVAIRVLLFDARSANECAERVAEYAGRTPHGEWILGFGYNEEHWSDRTPPTKEMLDRVAPNNPVMLYRIDTHGAWGNSSALRITGLDDPSRQIDGGSIAVDESGAPTGILIDNAIKIAERARPRPSVETQRAWIEGAVGECLRWGITEVHDMNVEPERLEPMTLAAERGGLRVRSQIFLQAQSDEWQVVHDPCDLATNLHVVGVKYFTDGALGSRGALLLEPYRDMPSTHGLGLISSEELASKATAAARRGYAIATHAIGDAANRLALDAYQLVRRDVPDALLRIEHAQIVHPVDLDRFAALRVIAAMQPTHCTSDARMADARLGPERTPHSYPWRSLLDRGTTIIAGSDFPVEHPNPFRGLRAFVERAPEGEEAPWHPEQRLTREEALDAFTRLAPAGIPSPAKRGVLEAGYDADIVVLDGDPFSKETDVVMTIVGGRIEYRRE